MVLFNCLCISLSYAEQFKMTIAPPSSTLWIITVLSFCSVFNSCLCCLVRLWATLYSLFLWRRRETSFSTSLQLVSVEAFLLGGGMKVRLPLNGVLGPAERAVLVTSSRPVVSLVSPDAEQEEWVRGLSWPQKNSLSLSVRKNLWEFVPSQLSKESFVLKQNKKKR